MIRPLDMQVALNAMPEQARSIHAEVAGNLYRNIQGAEQARREILERQSRINESNSRDQASFRTIGHDDQRPGFHMLQMARSDQAQRSERELPSQRLYGNSGQRQSFHRAYNEEGLGRSFDLFV